MTDEEKKAWILSQLAAGKELFWWCARDNRLHDCAIWAVESPRVGTLFPLHVLVDLMESGAVMLTLAPSVELPRWQLWLVPDVPVGPVLVERTRCLL